jgi:hypothetical protein
MSLAGERAAIPDTIIQPEAPPPMAIRLIFVCVCLVLAPLTSGCEQRLYEIPAPVALPPDAGPVDAPAFDGGFTLPPADATVDGDVAMCVPGTCDRSGGRYCGTIGDGCGGILECGGCPMGQMCGAAGTANVCAPADPNCVPKTCDQVGGKYCGLVGDGCGKPLDCGDCPAGETCSAVTPNVCGKAGPCTPLTCSQAGGKYCGVIGDGCGKMIDCGGCDGGLTCGGDGVQGVCGGPLPGCTAGTCDVAAGRFCGRIGDGCGRRLDCGECPAGQSASAYGYCNSGSCCTAHAR